MRSLPIRKDDEVQIVKGKFAKEPTGKVTSVYRRRYCIYIDRIVKEKANGSQVCSLVASVQNNAFRVTESECTFGVFWCAFVLDMTKSFEARNDPLGFSYENARFFFFSLGCE